VPTVEAALAPEAAPLESTEALREALFTLRRDHDALATTAAQAQQLLDALESLLAMGPDDEPFARVFASLHSVFAFDHAMLLAEHGAPAANAGRPGAEQDTGVDPTLECIVADPAALSGLRWPVGPLFRKVMGGRVVVTFSNADAQEWRAMARPLESLLPHWAGQPSLHLPVRTRDGNGILLLMRRVGAPGFDRQDAALGRRFSVLVSHALAARTASRSAAEERRLRELSERLQRSEQQTRRDAELLQALVDLLPVGVAVQDAKGRFQLVNDAAASAFGMPAAAMMQSAAMHLLSGSDGNPARSRAAFDQHLASGRLRTRERSIPAPTGARSLLITGKPVTIFNERLMLSTSLDITEHKRLEQDLARRAFHDALTGLPNRGRMSDIVDATLRQHRLSGGMFGLAFIDLDNFKRINDYYSHALGDALLKAVTRRIGQTIRSGDTLARISGDEFLLLIDPLASVADLPPLIERVTEALKQPFEVESHEILTSASVGAAVFPLHGDSYEALCRCADSAMYRAKDQRKGSVGYFDRSMGEALTARMETEQRLRVAIRERHFRAAFQPKLRLADGSVDGFEALVRWVQPDGCVQLPGSFIDIASELGLLDDITDFVLDDVARQLPTLVAKFGAGISVSINVSARQAGDLAFMQGLTERLVALGVAGRVVLELTEEALIATQRFQREVLPLLRTAGVRVSIDDFGTGYSSLAMLADITADEVKVDRSLITAIHERPRSQGILRAIESLCTALGMQVVAEGVETDAELAYLQQHTAIRIAQGYRFSRPMFVEALLDARFG